MSTDPNPSPVIVETGATAHASSVYHRDFPEIRGEGETPATAASNLVNHLARALDSALTPSRREIIEHAIAEVKTFATKGS